MLPSVGRSLLVRTDFSDDAAWHALCRATEADGDDTDDPFLEYIDDRDFESATVAEVSGAVPAVGQTGCVYLADAETMAGPDHSVVAVDLREEPGRFFRIIPSEVRAFDVNMMISNMDFADFADAVMPDGVFRGFSGGGRSAAGADDPSGAEADIQPAVGQLPTPPGLNPRAAHALADSDFTVLPVPEIGRPGFYWQWLANERNALSLATPVTLILERLSGEETVGWRMWAACADGTVRGLSPSRPGSGTLVPWPVDGVG